MSKDSRETKEAPLPVDRIVPAATEVFGHFGFAKATIQDIVAAAQVSKPLFYRRYANKQAIFERVVEQVLSDWREAIVDVVAETPGGAEAARRGRRRRDASSGSTRIR